jgi:hypothetical protein
MDTESEVVEFVSSSKSEFEGKKRFVFTLSATQVSGNDEIYFVIAYDTYGYKYTTECFEVESFDAIKSIQILTDGLVPNSNTAVAYHEYYGSKIGLQIDTEVTPSTIPEEQKVLILERQTGASNYTFFKKNAFGFAEEIEFVEDKYEFVSGEPIYVKANSMQVDNGTIKIYEKVNPVFDKLRIRPVDENPLFKDRLYRIPITENEVKREKILEELEKYGYTHDRLIPDSIWSVVKECCDNLIKDYVSE